MVTPDIILSLALNISFALLGICLGSFATAVIYREGHKVPWYRFEGALKRSYCPACRSPLEVRDLVPVFSWLWLGGKCRNCSKPITFFYPMIELISGLAAVVIFQISGLALQTLFLLAALPFVIALIYLLIVYKMATSRLITILFSIGVFWFLFLILAGTN